jgi:hypothetical protein
MDSSTARIAGSFRQIPLLKGEGAAKRRVRGAEKHLFTPHPARFREPPSPFGRGMRKHIPQLAALR